ncbi:MAG: XVIPCD domain-containing protein [Pseudomonadota bacterium]
MNQPTSNQPLLNDPRNPNNQLYSTTLAGVSGLDPAKVPLNRNEQANVAGALTANMTNTPGFERNNPNPSNISIASSQTGDRVFAINGQNPSAPNAVYTSVDVNQARVQPLEVSTALANVPSRTPPVQEQPPPQLDTGGVNPRMN